MWQRCASSSSPKISRPFVTSNGDRISLFCSTLSQNVLRAKEGKGKLFHFCLAHQQTRESYCCWEKRWSSIMCLNFFRIWGLHEVESRGEQLLLPLHRSSDSTETGRCSRLAVVQRWWDFTSAVHLGILLASCSCSLFVVGGWISQVRVFYGKGQNCDSEFQQTSEKLLKSHMLGGGFCPSGLVDVRSCRGALEQFAICAFFVVFLSNSSTLMLPQIGPAAVLLCCSASWTEVEGGRIEGAAGVWVVWPGNSSSLVLTPL